MRLIIILCFLLLLVAHFYDREQREKELTGQVFIASDGTHYLCILSPNGVWCEREDADNMRFVPNSIWRKPGTDL